VLQHLPGIGSVGRHRERRHAIGLLAFDPQQLAAGRQNRGLRAGANNRLGESRGHVDDVLAIVEQQQDAPSPDRARHRLRRHLPGFDFQVESARNGRVNHFLVAHAGKLDVLDVASELRNEAARDLEAEPGLADSARPGDRDHPHLSEPVADETDFRVAADQLRNPQRQVAFTTDNCGRPGRNRTRLGGPPLPGQAIAAPEHRLEHGAIRTERPAQGRDVHLQGILADDRARPHAIEQLRLGHNLAVRADHNLEQLKGPAADGRDLSVGTKFAPGIRSNTEW